MIREVGSREPFELTQEIVKELIHYDPETGKLFWKERDVKWFVNEGSKKKWNTKYANKEAFIGDSHGYKNGSLLYNNLFAHRLIWFYMTGEWPDQIDHINGVPSDNRWVNLRNVSNHENRKNCKKRKDNTSGFSGVRFHRTKYQARIFVNGKEKHIGVYDTIEEAVAARKQAEIQYGFHENHGRAE